MSTLFVVATPIGNLGDISRRAIEVLASVDVIAAEDTRHTGQLLSELSITTRLIAFHDHNEEQSAEGIVQMLAQGLTVAVVSDAGTPLISDPGYLLVRRCLAEGVNVAVVPGPSSITAALSVAGIPTNRFTFEGFLPAKQGARRELLKALKFETRTQVFLESPHRISDTLEEMEKVIGPERELSVCREMTKTFEQIVMGPISDIAAMIRDGRIPSKGEFVLVLRGNDNALAVDADQLLRALLAELSPSKAAAIAAKATAVSRSELYERALSLKKDDQ